MRENILEILGVSGKEDVISNLLCHLLNTSQVFCVAFLRNICGIDSSEVTLERALTRVTTNSSGVPDLVIAAQSGGQKHLVIIENKLKAEEGSDQTVRYSSPECVEDLENHVGWSGGGVAVTFIFLALFPDQKPEAEVFQLKTYQDFLQAIQGLAPPEDAIARLLLDAWSSLLTRFYLKASIAPNDLLLAKLQEADPLEGNYLFFKSFVRGLSLSRGLLVEHTFRSSARGRRYFGAIISKPTWHPAEMLELGGTYHLDARKNFNIHFEPQFHYLKGVMELYVHYEVNPYNTAEWVRRNVPETQIALYNNVRENFVNSLRSKAIPALAVGGGSNQVAKARISLKDITVSAAWTAMAEVINSVAVSIDEIRDDSRGVFAA